MPNLTLSVSQDIKEAMDRFKEINWSEVARQAIRDRVRVLMTMNRLLEGSRLTEADIAREARAIKKQAWKRQQASQRRQS